MGSKPARDDENPSTGINWKLFLLVAGIAGIAIAAFTLLPSGEGDGASADIDSSGVDVGQSSGQNNQLAVETETQDTEEMAAEATELKGIEVIEIDDGGIGVSSLSQVNAKYSYKCDSRITFEEILVKRDDVEKITLNTHTANIINVSWEKQGEGRDKGKIRMVGYLKANTRYGSATSINSCCACRKSRLIDTSPNAFTSYYEVSRNQIGNRLDKEAYDEYWEGKFFLSEAISQKDFKRVKFVYLDLS